jgi:periplasmic divalent cation tolerance protein
LALVRTTLDDAEKARILARRLVDEGLAACVHASEVQSTYRWQGKVHEETETLLECRVAPAGVAALRKRILALHPYEVPLVEVLDVRGVPPSYMDWVHGAI